MLEKKLTNRFRRTFCTQQPEAVAQVEESKATSRP